MRSAARFILIRHLRAEAERLRQIPARREVLSNYHAAVRRFVMVATNLTPTLPTTGLHEVLFFDGCRGEAFHAVDDCFGGFGDDLRVVEVRCCNDDGAGAGDSLFTLEWIVFDVQGGGAFLHEDARANEDGLGAE